MSRLNVFGWGLMTVGCVLWLYGYLADGHAALIAWSELLPGWIAEFVPNLEAEVGMATMIAAMVPTYWPNR
ncbi:MAG: hypothetical protein WD036_09055 [Bauldia sp.]